MAAINRGLLRLLLPNERGADYLRRKDREKDVVFAMEVLRESDYATLATVNPDGTPYCVPISPVLMGETVYFHCAAEGKKLDNIKQNNNVCISCACDVKPMPENFTTLYKSAVLTGKCEIVSDDTEKKLALREICEKYAKSNMSGFDSQIEKYLHKTCVCKIVVEKITGKANIK